MWQPVCQIETPEFAFVFWLHSFFIVFCPTSAFTTRVQGFGISLTCNVSLGQFSEADLKLLLKFFAGFFLSEETSDVPYSVVYMLLRVVNSVQQFEVDSL